MLHRYARPLFNNYGEIIGYQIIETNYPLIQDQEAVKEKQKTGKQITIDDVLDIAKFLKNFNGRFDEILK